MKSVAEADRSGRWPVWKLALLLYIPCAGAAAVNFFFLGLLLQALGITAFGPWQSAAAGLGLGLPASWFAGRWFRRMMDTAEGWE